jgi:capsular exopolysaccharide synthesis family protein
LEEEKFNLTTQLELAKSLQQNLQSQSNFSLLPSNIGISNTNVNELVMAYNTLILKRNGLLSGATERNPIITQLSTELTDLKQNIHRSIDNYLDNIETSLSKFNEFKNTTSAKISEIPLLNATLQGFERKFQIAENLYLFLLQKREEASISYEATMPDTRVINYAYTNKDPVAPKSSVILLGALLFGVLIPYGLLYILKILDTKIHTREDLEQDFNGINILGEVPFVQEKSSIYDSRGFFAESARVIRSNINYKLPQYNGCKIILTTSSIKGEGKTLTNFNLAASYVASGKKVLLIGADLRNPKVHSVIDISRKNNEKGLSSLLVDSNLELKSLITSIDLFNSKLDILLSGPIPPNPAELLGSVAFDNLLELLKKDYDYIFIDSAPLILVSDTIPLLKHADLIIYTTRANVTDKKIGQYVQKLVDDKKIKNIGLILNGIKTGSHSYYQYGYSYRYSYAYKYGYNYSYGNIEN